MKLVFTKSASDNKLTIKIGSDEKKFDHVYLIKQLIDGEEMEKSEFNGEFSVEEISAVEAMIKKIKSAVNEKQGADELDIASLLDEQDYEVRVEDIPF